VQRHSSFRNRLLYGSDMPIINSFLTSPWWHAYRVTLPEVLRLAAIRNPWDRDVELKMALGAPEEVLIQGSRVLKLHGQPQGGSQPRAQEGTV
jgi:hypothetical protein